MLKVFVLALVLALQGTPITLSMNTEATLFSVAFPKDTVVQSCIKFESQTERIVLDGVDQKYTPSSCILFMDSLVESGPDGVLVEVGTPSTGYEDAFPLNRFGPGEWHVWAEAKVVGSDTWQKSNVIVWTNPATSVQ